MICICITTKFSGSMQSATTARNMILEEYPKARITVIDAEINTVRRVCMYLRHAGCATSAGV